MKIVVYALVVLAYSQYVFGKYCFFHSLQTKYEIRDCFVLSFAIAVTNQKNKWQPFQIVSVGVSLGKTECINKNGKVSRFY